MRKTASILLLAMMVPAYAEDASSAVIDAMETYLDFVEFGGGIVQARQIADGKWKDFHIIDVRLPEDYASGHIQSAVNIEWRNVLARRDEIPRDKLVLLYCNTGAQSAQAFFALRVAGWDNARLLQGGIEAWRRDADEKTVVK